MTSRRVRSQNFFKAIEENDVNEVRDSLRENQDLVGKGEKSPKSPLWTAATLGNHKIVELLIKFGALGNNKKKYFNYVDSSVRHSLLHWMASEVMSCNESHAKVGEVLIRHGADVNVLDCNGETPLQYAIQKGNVDWAEFLLQNGAKLNGLVWNLKTLEFHIYKNSNIYSRKDMLTLLLKHGLDPRFRDKSGKTHLHLLIEYSNMYVDSVEELAKDFIDAGVSIDEADNDGYSPLHYSVFTKNVEFVKFLVSNGANVNTQSKWLNTSLHLAFKDNDPSEAIIDLLLSHGADVREENENEQTALHIACRSYCNEKIVTLLIRIGADLNTRDKDARTPLHYACNRNEANAKIISILIREGADISAKDEDGDTPFSLLFQFNPWEVRDATYVFVKKFSRLRLDNIPIDEKDVKLIQTERKTREYFEKCLIELPQLSEVEFYSHYSFYTILMFNNIKKLSKLTRNEKFVSSFHAKVENFFCFKEDLIEKLDEAMKVRDEEDDVYFRLKSIFRDFPDVVLRILTDELVPDDLPLD